MELNTLGWNTTWEQAFADHAPAGCAPARVSAEHRGLYTVITATQELAARVSGALRHGALSRRDFPAVGDWVAVELPPGDGTAVIQALLPRSSAFVRKAAGPRSEEQLVAANVDTAFLVSGLDGNFKPRRLERYLTLAAESGAAPVVVLNKVDLCPDLERARLLTEAVAGDAPVLLMSAASGAGVEALLDHLVPGATGVLLGSSGVGKSTLINALLGRQELRTTAVRAADSRGRHTTTHRQLLSLPNGALLIDTPGMRELQLLGDDSALEQSFGDIEALARRCRFRDCAHSGEPGCAVQEALGAGALEVERYESYLAQQKELQYHRRELDVQLQIQEMRRWRAIHRAHRRRSRGDDAW